MVYNYNDKIIIPKYKTFEIGTGKKTVVKNNIPMSFDIETTNVIESKSSYMYIWMFSISDNVYIGRTWEEFHSFIEELTHIGINGISTILVHNLPFEMSYLLPRLEMWEMLKSVFAKEQNKPINVKLNNGLEFIDTLALTNLSLSNLAKNYCETQKLVGDLDYSIYRNSKTKLNKNEMNYCINDVLILSEYALYLHREYTEHNESIPLTSTSIVRRFMKNKVKQGNYYTKHIGQSHPDSKQKYSALMCYLFRGGFTHANVTHCDKVLYNVTSYDLTSAYPSALFNKFPTRFYENNTITDLDYLINNDIPFWAMVTFTDIETTTSHSVESKNKIIKAIDDTYDNGRLIKAKNITVMITDIDYKIYKMFYKWKKLTLEHLEISRYEPLPDYVLDTVAEFYIDKKNYKAIKNKIRQEEQQYLSIKGKLNSIYGMMVTRFNMEEHTYTNGEWETKETDNYEREKSKAFLSMYWGIWTTAYVRYTILSQIYKMGNDAVYSDTDSIKFINNHDDIFNEYNDELLKRNKSLKQNKNGLLDDIGLFDYEGSYKQFKTLGAKRYIYTDNNHTNVVVAGLPKSATDDYIKANGEQSIYDIFEDGMIFEKANKLTHTYHKYCTDIVEGEKMTEYGGCYLEETSFKMTIDETFKNLIRRWI